MKTSLPAPIEKFISQHLNTSDFEVVQLAGDASARRYFRIGTDTQSLVLMMWEPFLDPDNYPFLNVQKHFLKYDVRVPKIEAIAPDLGIVLQEDLGDLTLERKFWENQNQELVLPYYFQANDELIKIHFDCSQKEKADPVCQTVVFDTAKFMWEMNYAREHLLEKVGGVRLSDKDQTALQSEFLKICEFLDKQPKYVSHRDYHSRNLMLKMNKIRVIDFQDARKGPIQYDLVSLVHDSYVRMSESSINTVLQDYITKAKDRSPKAVDWKAFDQVMKVQTIQRCFKACGSFSSFFNMRNDNRYLKYILPTVKLVASTLEEVGTYPVLSGILRDQGFLEKNYEGLCAP